MDRLNGYNLESGGDFNRVWSEESKEKQRGRNNPMYGKKWNDRQRTNITLANRANSKILTEKDVIEIKQKMVSGISQRKISEELFQILHI